jgi:hypothetical protein
MSRKAYSGLIGLILAIVTISMFAIEFATASPFTVGADGSVPPGGNTWKGRHYKTLEIEQGTWVSFKWRQFHGLYQAEDKHDWQHCHDGHPLVEPKEHGEYLLDTSSYHPGTKLYYYCPVHGHCGHKLYIKIVRFKECHRIHKPWLCSWRPHCEWDHGHCVEVPA